MDCIRPSYISRSYFCLLVHTDPEFREIKNIIKIKIKRGGGGNILDTHTPYVVDTLSLCTCYGTNPGCYSTKPGCSQTNLQFDVHFFFLGGGGGAGF